MPPTRRRIPRKRFMMAYKSETDNVGPHGLYTITHSLIDTLFMEVKSLQNKPTPEIFMRIYKLGPRDEGKFRYKPSARYLAFLRLLRMKQLRREKQQSSFSQLLKN
jgi:hypothetical protein